MENLCIEFIDEETIKINGEIKKESKLSTWRSIFLTDEYVIKFDVRESKQCTKENHLFNRIKGTQDEKYFASILEYGESNGVKYIIQKRLRVTRNKIHTNELENTLDYLQGKFGLWDLADRNFTIQRKQVVVFDYGSY